MIDVEALYFKWLIEEKLDAPGAAFERLCLMLHQNVFERNVGNDMNRAADGINLRRQFLSDYDDARISPSLSNDLMGYECTWFEMLVALSEALDFIYDGGIGGRFREIIDNLGLTKILNIDPEAQEDGRFDVVDQDFVDSTTARVDRNLFNADGRDGLFPLIKTDHPDQRGVEIWEQAGTYFRERLEGVLWTSTS